MSETAVVYGPSRGTRCLSVVCDLCFSTKRLRSQQSESHSLGTSPTYARWYIGAKLNKAMCLLFFGTEFAWCVDVTLTGENALLSIVYTVCAAIVFIAVSRNGGRSGWSRVDTWSAGIGLSAILVGLLAGNPVVGCAIAYLAGAIPNALDSLEDDREPMSVWLIWLFGSVLVIHFEWESGDVASMLALVILVSEGLGISGVLILMRFIKQRRSRVNVL